ncbi:MAG: hypothetical protein ACOCY0_05845 [Roseicyclus sp.]
MKDVAEGMPVAQARREQEATAAMPRVERLAARVRIIGEPGALDVVELTLDSGAVVMWYPTAAAWDFWCEFKGDIGTRDGEAEAFLEWLEARVGARLVQ